jgi:hypothetical protein
MVFVFLTEKEVPICLQVSTVFLFCTGVRKLQLHHGTAFRVMRGADVHTQMSISARCRCPHSNEHLGTVPGDRQIEARADPAGHHRGDVEEANVATLGKSRQQQPDFLATRPNCSLFFSCRSWVEQKPKKM